MDTPTGKRKPPSVAPWWHPGGNEIELVENPAIPKDPNGKAVAKENLVMLASDTAKLAIIWRPEKATFLLRAEIRHHDQDGEQYGRDEMVRRFTIDHLIKAFELEGHQDVDASGHIVSSQHRGKGTRSSQGRFFATGKYLNIPIAEEAINGMPAISVLIKPKIKQAVQALVNRAKTDLKEKYLV